MNIMNKLYLVGIIPRSWRRYIVPAGLTVIQWVTDFSERIKQLQSVSKQVATNGSKVLKVRFAFFLFTFGDWDIV